MFDDMDKSARRSVQANTKPAWHVALWRAVKGWHAKLPRKVDIFFDLVLIAALIGIAAWEAWQSAQGWILLTTGAAPSQFAFVVGACATVGYISFHRRAMERNRDAKQAVRDKQEAWEIEGLKERSFRAAVTACLLAAMSLAGVFSNLASKSAVTSEHASEINSERTALMAEAIQLDADINNANPDLVNALLAGKDSRLKSMLAEARGWGMQDLNADGACAADLARRQRELCNAANGTDIKDGIIGEVAALKAELAKLNKWQARRAEVQAQLDSVQVEEGAEHWKAMSEITNGNIRSDQFRIWGMLVASFIFLFVAGFGLDEMFERVESKKARNEWI